MVLVLITILFMIALIAALILPRAAIAVLSVLGMMWVDTLPESTTKLVALGFLMLMLLWSLEAMAPRSWK